MNTLQAAHESPPMLPIDEQSKEKLESMSSEDLGDLMDLVIDELGKAKRDNKGQVVDALQKYLARIQIIWQRKEELK